MEDIKIQLNSTGIKSIPLIKEGKIITIRGRNGVGKSMAATLLEIAAGDYIFTDKNKFDKLKSKLGSCTIKFYLNKSNMGEIKLNPSLWRFDEKTNRINPLTIGNFYLNGEKLELNNLETFKKNFFVRVIRGNESLSEQIIFFIRIFYSKIDRKINDLIKFRSNLDRYKQYFFNIIPEEVLEQEETILADQVEILNKIENLNDKERILKNDLVIIENDIEILPDLIFVLKNNQESIKKQIEEKNKEINVYDNEYKELVLKQNTVKNTLEELEKNYNKEEKKIIEKKKKFTEEILNFLKELNKIDARYPTEINETDKNRVIREIIERKKELEEEKKSIKIKIDNFEDTHREYINIEKVLERLEESAHEIVDHGWGDKKLISIQIEGINKKFNFKELFKIFKENHENYIKNMKDPEFENKSKELKEQHKKIDTQLKLIEKILDKIKKKDEFEEKTPGKNSKLEDFIKLEDRIKELNKRKQELKIELEEKEKFKREAIKDKEKLEKILSQFEGKKSIISYQQELKTDILKKFQDYDPNKLEPNILEEKLKDIMDLKEDQNKKLTNIQYDLDNLRKKLEEIQNQITKNQPYFEKASKILKISKDKIKEYITDHKMKINKLYTKINNLEKEFNKIKDVLRRLIENKSIKSGKHKEIILDYFDHLFKQIYDNKSFFKYVFSEYSKIIRFDIEKKLIIFLTKDGSKEEKTLDDFSSGEKTYAYCRSIILMSQNIAKYPIVILDESYALLDKEHSADLYEFQNKMIQENKIAKFINILPFKEDLELYIRSLKKLEKSQLSAGNISSSQEASKDIKLIERFKEELDKYGYFQVTEWHDNLLLKTILKQIDTLKGNIDTSESQADAVNSNEYNEEIKGLTIVLDGSNIARNNTASKTANLQDVIKVRKILIKNYKIPKKNIFIIFGAGLKYYLREMDKIEYEKLLREANILQAPGGTNDDWFIIDFARKNNSYIISNDLYRDFQEKYPDLKSFLKEHRFGFMVLRNHISFDERFQNLLNNLVFE
ncbi:MAG: NYN domain-containing protein [Promethearchaeota archaeon]